MRTLLVESSPGSGAAAELELASAGVEISRCHAPFAEVFPCTEITDPGSCPLSGADRPDVVFVARASADRRATLAEAGVSCALRHRVPVVVDHDPEVGTNPFGEFVDVVQDLDRVGACEAAIAGAQDREVAPLVAEVARLIEANTGAADAAVGVTLHRTGETVRINVDVPADVGLPDEQIAVRVHDRYRQIPTDGRPQLIDVGVTRR